MQQKFKLNGLFTARQYRDSKLIRVIEGHNGFTTEGQNHLLDVVFGNSSPVTQVDPWYIGLINNSPAPTLVAGDTLASHSGWSETTDYTGNRQAWVDANASSGSKASSSVATFPMTGTVTVYGIFICSVATGTSGTLWSTGAFDSTISLINGDDLKVSYTLGF